ncbi:hypothetical protein Fifi44_00057 [Erwinia phage Fifi44]|uniref:Uncharacterized protein n=1 Tax=Erwinia phage Fifi44 TaxID=2876597 RepID=A0AAE8Y1J2_9CAUD|nr:hypothetical protein QNG95_gp57 [Erwinia phage Fifi44]QQV88360.1 hypothetical protein pEaSNUABM27_00058 [Erwinia phage pEa_SNUABM_27]UCR74926.1 hypothetical protein Fifi44_00057 [Erwinia phage Fifi44]UCR80841.1 hypothetical protein Fifi451_00021 [Erwinia phage Fifi451]
MQLKNNLSGNVQLFYPVKKNGQPDVDFIHIPGGATVELDDKVFEALCKPLTTIKEQRMVEVEIEGEAEVKMDKKNVLIKEFYETGEVKIVNLFKEQIKKGDFTVVERPSISKEQKLAVLNQNGVSVKDLSDEQIDALYDKLA